MEQYTNVLKSTHFGEKNTSWLMQSSHGVDFDTWNARIEALLVLGFTDDQLLKIYDDLNGNIVVINSYIDKYMAKCKTSRSLAKVSARAFGTDTATTMAEAKTALCENQQWDVSILAERLKVLKTVLALRDDSEKLVGVRAIMEGTCPLVQALHDVINDDLGMCVYGALIGLNPPLLQL
jgi:hypothetical protein